MFNRASLARNATAPDIDINIVFSQGLCQLQRLADNHLGGLPLEIFVNVTLVYGDVTISRPKPYPGDGCLPFASGVVTFLTQELAPVLSRVERAAEAVGPHGDDLSQHTP